jgi:hypothetical protein
MTFMVNLTPDQHERLHSAAIERGLSDEAMLHQIVIDALDRLVPPAESSGQLPRRIAGLHQGQGWMSPDFNDPLPDSFWLGDESDPLLI